MTIEGWIKRLIKESEEQSFKEKLPEKHVFQKCPQCGFEVMFDDGVVVYCRICKHIMGHEHWQYRGKVEIGKGLHIHVTPRDYDKITSVAVFCHKNKIPFKISVLTQDA